MPTLVPAVISTGAAQKNERSLPKSAITEAASIQQAVQIKELEAKIKRLEAENKANAETAKEQKLIQQVVMPQIVSLTQRV